jgi:hypothetical protein
MPTEKDAEHRYRLWYLKDEVVRLLGHLDTVRIVERMLRQAELPLVYTEGFSRKPKLTTCPPLPLGYTSRMELLDFHTYEKLDTNDALARLRKAAVPRSLFHKLRRLTEKELPLSKCLHSMLVELVFVNSDREEFLNEDCFATFLGGLSEEQLPAVKGMLGWGISAGRLKLNALVRGETMPLAKLTKVVREHFGADFVTGERVMFLREDGSLAY